MGTEPPTTDPQGGTDVGPGPGYWFAGPNAAPDYRDRERTQRVTIEYSHGSRTELRPVRQRIDVQFIGPAWPFHVDQEAGGDRPFDWSN